MWTSPRGSIGINYYVSRYDYDTNNDNINNVNINNRYTCNGYSSKIYQWIE
jgi:hypothetical protein